MAYTQAICKTQGIETTIFTLNVSKKIYETKHNYQFYCPHPSCQAELELCQLKSGNYFFRAKSAKQHVSDCPHLSQKTKDVSEEKAEQSVKRLYRRYHPTYGIHTGRLSGGHRGISEEDYIPTRTVETLSASDVRCSLRGYIESIRIINQMPRHIYVNLTPLCSYTKSVLIKEHNFADFDAIMYKFESIKHDMETNPNKKAEIICFGYVNEKSSGLNLVPPYRQAMLVDGKPLVRG